LLVYNVRGQQVAVLVDRDQPAGFYEVEWRGTDRRGQELASGVYFYRLQAGERVFIRKMVLLK
jgi:flagellar hook assembly protein FlgD